MSKRLGTLLLLVLALAAGCAGTGDDVESTARKGAPLSAADLGWLERYGNWFTRYNRAATYAGETNAALLGGASSVTELERSLQPVRECEQSFQRSVAREESTRFKLVEPLVGRACEQLRLGAEGLIKSFSDPATHAYAAEEHYSKAQGLFLDVDAAIQRRLVANRPLPAIAARSKESRADPRLGRIASRLASRSVDVRCWSSAEWPGILRESEVYGDRNVDFVGMADPLRNRIHLAPAICKGLSLILDRKNSVPRLMAGEDIAEVVETFAHEIEHILGRGTERRVECAAVQRTAQIAQALGMSRSFALKLARVYWLKVYPDMPDNYWSPHCKSGGAFDEHPESARWPTP